MASEEIRSTELLSDWEEPPLVVVVSAPSGTGKSTICRQLIDSAGSSSTCQQEIEFSVSTTTRKPRRNEKDGMNYHFVDDETFETMKRNDEFLEDAIVHGERYGTPRSAVQTTLESGKDVLLDIDVQGGRQVKEQCDEAVLVFIAPPDLDELERRLRNRGTEDESEISRRLREASDELNSIDLYDYVVINDEIERAVEKINAIRAAEKCRLNRQFNDKKI